MSFTFMLKYMDKSFPPSDKSMKFRVPAVFLLGELRLLDVQAGREWILVLLVLVLAGILVEHSNLGAQGFLRERHDE